MKTEKENKKFFPVFIDLSTKRVVVFGAGKIATRRAETLLSFAGELIVIAPACTERIAQLFEEGKLVYKEKLMTGKICMQQMWCWLPQMIQKSMRTFTAPANVWGFR